MKIITFHNAPAGEPTTAHVWNGRNSRTACGLHVAGRAGPTNIASDDVHLCGNCQKVIEAKGSTMWWRYAA